jgi:hypothetical protein
LTDDGHAQPTEPRRYAVRLIFVDGSSRTVRVISHLGREKAIFLAGATLKSALGRTPYRIEVDDLGFAEGLESGYVFDRSEW